MVNVRIDYDKCKGHGVCVDVCPQGVFEKRGDEFVVVRPESCIGCRACEASCPENAISVDD